MGGGGTFFVLINILLFYFLYLIYKVCGPKSPLKLILKKVEMQTSGKSSEHTVKSYCKIHEMNLIDKNGYK